MNILIPILSFLLIAVGIVGVVLPFLPGVPLAWLGVFIYAYFTDFTVLSLNTILVFLALTLLTFVVDWVSPLIGAKKYNASKYGVMGASLGFLLGVFILGPIGIIFGPLAGAFIGETIAGKDATKSFQSAWGVFIGFLAGSLIKIVITLIMFGFFLAALF